MEKTVLNGIGLCRAKIERRERQREELEKVKGIIKPETYRRVKADIYRDIQTSTKKLQETRAIIENHPHELQRKILYYKWEEGKTLPEIAEMLLYCVDYINKQHAKAIREINLKYRPEKE